MIVLALHQKLAMTISHRIVDLLFTKSVVTVKMALPSLFTGGLVKPSGRSIRCVTVLVVFVFRLMINTTSAALIVSLKKRWEYLTTFTNMEFDIVQLERHAGAVGSGACGVVPLGKETAAVAL